MADTFHVIREGIVLEFRREPEGGYTVSVPALPGCLSYGETFEEGMAMIEECHRRLAGGRQRRRVRHSRAVQRTRQGFLVGYMADKLPALRAEQIVKALERAGFSVKRQTGSPAILTRAGLRRPVAIPLHRRELPRRTVQDIIRQAGVTTDQLLEHL